MNYFWVSVISRRSKFRGSEGDSVVRGLQDEVTHGKVIWKGEHPYLIMVMGRHQVLQRSQSVGTVKRRKRHMLVWGSSFHDLF